MENNEISTDIEPSYFYEVEGDDGRVYKIPDLSDNVDLVKLVLDSSSSHKYSPEIKIQAAALWCVLGSSYKVEKFMGLQARTIRQWYSQPWWHIAVRETRKLKNEEMDSQLTGLLEQTMEEIQDRLANGEAIVTKEGSLKRIPVSTRNLATLLGVMYDKRAIIRSDPNSKQAKTDVAEHLEKVATKLEKLVGKIPEPEIIEGEFTEDG